MSETGIINISDFAWLDGNILELNPFDHFVKIRLPQGFVLDKEIARGIFINNEKCVSRFERQGRIIEQTIEGNIADPALYQFISKLSTYTKTRISFTQ